MLKSSPASPGLLFVSFLFRQDLFSSQELISFWEEKFGSSFSLIPQDNPLNEYYIKEMGGPLARVFLVSSKSFPREFLLSVKLQAMEWENNWAVEGKRRINVDVGLLSLENFLLATTKNYSHRIYLGQNIFADLTYQFQEGEFVTLPWTYPDYTATEKINFFNWGRSYLLQSRTTDL